MVKVRDRRSQEQWFNWENMEEKEHKLTKNLNRKKNKNIEEL